MKPDRPRYTWPRYVLAGLLFWMVLILIWMAVLIHRTREQRDNMNWMMTPNPASAPSKPVAPTNSLAPKTNSSAAQSPADAEHAARMAEFSDTLHGGNAEAGRKIFFESPAANCGKCHKAGGLGGGNGPVLDGISARQSREFILESILFPNAVINSNFQTVVLQLKGDTSASGTLKSETESNLVLVTPEDGPVTIEKSKIVQRWIGASPMPEGIWQSLSKQDLRNLIEFVATLK